MRTIADLVEGPSARELMEASKARAERMREEVAASRLRAAAIRAQRVEAERLLREIRASARARRSQEAA